MKIYETYEQMRNTPPHYIDKSVEDQEKMKALFSISVAGISE